MTIDVRIRPAEPADAAAIAALHTASWRSTYRGILADTYLDGPVDDDRRAVWAQRLIAPPPGQIVLVADPGAAGIVGFGCWYAAADAHWGSLLDNLHVAQDQRGRGIGGRLLAAGAARCAEEAPGIGVHLWVLAGNDAATGFYRRLGAVPAGAGSWDAPDGRSIPEVRMAWPPPGGWAPPAPTAG